MTDSTPSARDDETPDIVDAQLLARLDRLRNATEGAVAPDILWSRFQESARLLELNHPQSPPASKRAHTQWRIARFAVAATLLIATGFVARRVSANADDLVPRESKGQFDSVAFAVQKSGTALVRALDAARAGSAQLSDSVRAEHREVALAALGSVILAGAEDYPRDVREILRSAPTLREDDRSTVPPDSSRTPSPRGAR